MIVDQRGQTKRQAGLTQHYYVFISPLTFFGQKFRNSWNLSMEAKFVQYNTRFKAINILSFESLLLPTFWSPEACLSHFTMHQVHKAYLYCDMYCCISFYLQKSIRFTI